MKIAVSWRPICQSFLSFTAAVFDPSLKQTCSMAIKATIMALALIGLSSQAGAVVTTTLKSEITKILAHATNDCSTVVLKERNTGVQHVVSIEGRLTNQHQLLLASLVHGRLILMSYNTDHQVCGLPRIATVTIY